MKVRPDLIAQVIPAMRRQGYFNQCDLAVDTEIAQSTVSKFCNGKPIYRANFQKLCAQLHLQWQDLYDQALDEDDEPDTAPLNAVLPVTAPPTAGLPLLFQGHEYPTGIVRLDSPYYLLRSPQEEQCYAEISQPGALIRIKAPRQFGKSSLLLRILHQAQQQGQQTLSLTLQAVEQSFLENSRQFLGWFCGMVANELGLADLKTAYDTLAPQVGSTSACLIYFEKYLLPHLKQPLTLGLDELDRILDAPSVCQDFFALLRVMNEKSKLGGIWQEFRLILVHATPAIEALVPLDINQSPFNVGLPITLREFTPAQIQTLAARYRLDCNDILVQAIMAWVGGSPFLVRLLLHRAAQEQLALPPLLADPARLLTLYTDPLQRLLQTLQRQPDLLQLMQTAARSTAPVVAPAWLGYQLQSTGLVTLEGDRMQPRCQLYRQYFGG
jgi:DNA-binding Xre family transcriptional regulator